MDSRPYLAQAQEGFTVKQNPDTPTARSPRNIGPRFGQFIVATLLVTLLGSCGGGSSEQGNGRDAPKYRIAGMVAGLTEGRIVLRNGLEELTIDASATLGEDYPFNFTTGLPTGALYEVQLVGDALAASSMECIVEQGSGTVQAKDINNILVRCAKIRSLHLVAGRIPLPAGADGFASTVQLNSPYGIATDSIGNIYVADTGNQLVRKITRAGAVITIAGLQGVQDYIDGAGTSSRLLQPTGLAINQSDEILVTTREYSLSDFNLAGAAIRKIAGNTISTVLVSNPIGYSSSGFIGRPTHIATSSDGSSYFIDRTCGALRSIGTTGHASALVNPGGAECDPGGLFSSKFETPRPPSSQALAVSDSKTLFVAFSDCTVRRLNLDSVTVDRITNIPGCSQNLGVNGLAHSRSGFLYFSIANSIKRVTLSSGLVETIAGSDAEPSYANGSGTIARFNAPTNLTIERDGSLLVSDTGNNLIRRILQPEMASKMITVSTVAGFAPSETPPDGVGVQAWFSQPSGLLVTMRSPDPLESFDKPHVFVADSKNNLVREIYPDGTTRTVSNQFKTPTAIAQLSDGSLLVTDTDNHAIKRITRTSGLNRLELFVGGTGSGSQDGPASSAKLNGPTGLAVGPDDSIYVADSGNHTIRKIQNGVVSTYSGVPNSPSTDPTDRTRLNAPFGIAFKKADKAGNDSSELLYVSEPASRRIRVIAIDNTTSSPHSVNTVAQGSPDSYARDDCANDVVAALREPTFLAVDDNGAVFFSDGPLIRTLHFRNLERPTRTEYCINTIVGTANNSNNSVIDVGKLPTTIGNPRGIGFTDQRIYFASEDAILYADR